MNRMVRIMNQRLFKNGIPLRPTNTRSFKKRNRMTMKKMITKQMILFICISALVSCGKTPDRKPDNPAYAVMQVGTTDREIHTAYSASIRGKQDIDIYPQVSGFLTKLYVEEGQAVRKGKYCLLSTRFHTVRCCRQQKLM